VYRREITRPRASAAPGSEFALITGPDQVKMDNLSYRIKVTTQVFDILSGMSDVDHPLCQECAELVYQELQHEIDLAEKEKEGYTKFLEKLSEQEDADDEAVCKELEALLKEENELKERLTAMEGERAVLANAMEKERQTLRQLEEEEKKYLRDLNALHRQHMELDDQRHSVNLQLKHAQSQLEKLKKTNVFNSTFHIWHSGHFGTINGFRLGRLPGVPIEWNEINAAWGQAVLLLQSLSLKVNLRFERYRLVPFGNQSYIEVLGEKKKELPLYGTGGLKFLWNTKFDQAMVAFLDCLQQFKLFIERMETGFNLPYRIDKDKIGDTGSGTYSIKITLNSEEHWTKALKFMLTDLKWGLAFVVAQLDKECAS
jgi:beclin 1